MKMLAEISIRLVALLAVARDAFYLLYSLAVSGDQSSFPIQSSK